MKKYFFIQNAIALLIFTSSLKAQDNNLVLNGSFENISSLPCGFGEYKKANSISSANNTSIDLYNVQTYSQDFGVPDNYMGNQLSQRGNNYVGIVAYYGDEAGIFKTVPGYQRYSEYIQLELGTTLMAGKPYLINFNVSLAEKSAYAVSGLGVYLSPEKLDVKNNAFLDVTPHLVACEIVNKTEWETVSGTYIAKGGERYLTIGCFKVCMDTLKVIPNLTNNSRKAYYYIDEVEVTSSIPPKEEDITSVLYGNCFMLQELNFEPHKSTILPESYSELKDLAHFLRTYPSLIVYIDGYAGEISSIESNEHLSEERALEVKKYLTAFGVKEDQLKARGFGNSDPVDLLNKDSAKNERVEITVCVTE